MTRLWKALKTPLSPGPERGNVPIIGAILFAGVAAATISHVKTSQELALKSQLLQERKFGAQLHNESALELASHLAGNTVLVKSGGGFKVGKGVKRLASGYWRLRKPRTLEVFSCDAFVPEDVADETYGRGNDTNDPASCKGRDPVLTVVTFDKFSASAVRATARTRFRVPTSGDTLVLKTRARIRIPPVEEGVERPDVCEFMVAQKLPDGSVRFQPNGKPYLEPRTDWRQKIQIPVNDDLYNDPDAPGIKSLMAAIDEATDDGVLPGVTKVKEFPDIHNLGIMNSTPNAQFLGFLVGTSTPMKTWPKDGTRDPRLKKGCKKTLGVHDADFCTKMRIRYKTLSLAVGGSSAITNRPFNMCVYFHHYDVESPRKCRRILGSYCRNNDGCFAPGTQITMADGSTRSVESLKAGDLVFNPVTRGGVRVDFVLSGPEKREMVRLKTSGGALEVTGLHPMLTPEGLVAAKHLAPGDRLLDQSLGWVEIVEKNMIPAPEGPVINLALDASEDDPREHMVLADGLISGDWHLQRLLERTGARLPLPEFSEELGELALGPVHQQEEGVAR